MHNSRRPASQSPFRIFLTAWPWPLTFWPNINWWARYRDGLSLCQVWWFEFQPFWFYHAVRQTDRITDKRITDAAKYLSHAISNNITAMTTSSATVHYRWVEQVSDLQSYRWLVGSLEWTSEEPWWEMTNDDECWWETMMKMKIT